MGERPDHLGNFNNDKNTYMVGIPLSPSTMYVDHPNENRLAAYQNDLTSRKRSNTSFQITSVTVQGSRTNTEDFEDSADDFEESHTDDISSDILDSSKFTEPDGYHSEDNTNPNIDDFSPCGPLILTPLTPATSEQSGMNVGLGINMGSPFPAIGSSMVNSGVTMMTSSIESPTSAQVPIISPLPDNWQHRFKVVKIMSSEPFKRGRWVCMDFRDPPTGENNNRCSIPAIHVTPSSFDNNNAVSNQQLNASNTVAHVFGIPVSSAYAEAMPANNQPMQQFYGILLPQSSNNNNPTAAGENISLMSDVNCNQINNNTAQIRNHSHPILFQTNQPIFTSGSSMTNVTFSQPLVLCNNTNQTNGMGINMHDGIPHQVPLDYRNNNDNNESDESTNITSNIPVVPSDTVAARNNSISITEDTESFCSLANQLSRTSGLSQSPPTQPSQLNAIGNGEYIGGRPRTPRPSISYTASLAVCCSTPSLTAQAAILPSSVTAELPISTASTGANTVAIDNKIEQAMDLVKSHLMFAVREEVEVLKEKITELLDRISQLEHENDILRANASPETLKQLNQSQKKFTVQQTGTPHIQNQPPSS